MDATMNRREILDASLGLKESSDGEWRETILPKNWHSGSTGNVSDNSEVFHKTAVKTRFYERMLLNPTDISISHIA